MVARDYQEIQNAVVRSIVNVCRLFERNKDYFLTEEDLRCHLFGEMMRKKILRKKDTTRNGTISVPVHTEVRWYGDSGRLKYRSDIVVIQVNDLKTAQSLKLPSKGYGFNKFDAVIELKLRRPNGEGEREFIRKIKSDVEKLKRLQREVAEGGVRAKYYLLVFDKKKRIVGIEDKIERPFPRDLVNFYYRYA